MVATTALYKSQLISIKEYTDKHKGKIKCHSCQSDLVAKRGTVVVHHFAHKSKQECDPWTQPMTEWHKTWQSIVPKELCEVALKRGGESHIADIKLENGLVVEIQHSPMTVATLEKRELFYQKMMWIVDAWNRPFKLCGTNVIILKAYGPWLALQWPVFLHTDHGLYLMINDLDKPKHS
ncbi:hypothetical protein AMAG_17077 [Allomyces macrogynus ATCC 38327]|uniref:Competence protein CoiA-like N-terminal domain-containing protein n=1 Tax=Allomyces macrogynus (strain ATCC 38327) TaxID=578462 RepID=A0A0L0TDE3_ALLM3|nr:hypothetical protein AMAG_17077 [Allomyces macrogynus ATCC 38327]|eukprot:KNE72747.1 hypothetical protein AMAG_17077 [Allomyces macrogynus ATCC 38327]